MARSVPDVLARARDLSAPVLRRAVDLLVPELRAVAAYHLGWLDERGQPTGGDGGKGLRPALAVLSAEAVGAPGDAGVPGAVAIELVHNYSLIHDDVMDNDTERRHRPTVWALHGVAKAIVVGDALAALAQQILLDPQLVSPIGDQLAGRRAALLLAEATARMIAGQALDLAFEERPDVTFAECLEMESGKTGALLGAAASVGAVLADAPEQTVCALDAFGMELGISFQAVDDLLGIWGDPAETGKPSWSDIRQHKKSLPVAAALSTGGALAEELAELYAVEELSERQIERAAVLVEKCGGRDATSDLASERLASALEALGGADIAEASHAEFVEVARFVVERKF